MILMDEYNVRKLIFLVKTNLLFSMFTRYASGYNRGKRIFVPNEVWLSSLI